MGESCESTKCLIESVNQARLADLILQLESLLIPLKGARGSPIYGTEITTFKIGGPLSLLIEPRSAQETVAVFAALKSSHIDALILGEGSNLFISDSGVLAPVVRPRGRTIEINGDAIGVEAGFPLMSLSRQASDAGLSGLEFAGGIPGSVGGAVFMNAGAHGSCFGDIVEWLEIATTDGLTRIRGQDLPWRYRHSGLSEILKATPGAVVRAGLRLKSSDRATTQELRARYLTERRLRQPLQAASAGSVFRNPSETESAGAVIERCGLKSLSIGGALVSPLHANWIINPKRLASAADVSSLIDRIKSVVKAVAGVELHEEIVKW